MNRNEDEGMEWERCPAHAKQAGSTEAAPAVYYHVSRGSSSHKYTVTRMYKLGEDCSEKVHRILQAANCSAVKTDLFDAPHLELASWSQILNHSLAAAKQSYK